MKFKVLLFTSIFLLPFSLVFGQNIDSIKLKVNGVESRELLDFYRFSAIDYFKLELSGNDIKEKYFLFTSNEYWNGSMTKVDTIANTKKHGFKNKKDTLEIRVMSKKTSSDSVRFLFHFPSFSTPREYQTTVKDTYSLRDITSRGEQIFSKQDVIDMLVYSLPYEDPSRPGYLFYCELSREGIPPERWGEKFGVEHYIVFKFNLLD